MTTTMQESKRELISMIRASIPLSILEFANDVVLQDSHSDFNVLMKSRGLDSDNKVTIRDYKQLEYYGFHADRGRLIGRQVTIMSDAFSGRRVEKEIHQLFELMEIMDVKTESNVDVLEQEILTLSSVMFTKFAKLEQTHPSDREDMAQAVHDIQKIIAIRMVRRTLPSVFPIKE